MHVIKQDRNYTITDVTEDELQRLINLTSGHFYPEVRHIKEALENPVETDCLYREMGVYEGENNGTD